MKRWTLVTTAAAALLAAAAAAIAGTGEIAEPKATDEKEAVNVVQEYVPELDGLAGLTGGAFVRP
jgi:hypothetical protein